MRSCRRSLVALLVVVMASACAVIPSSGPVTKVADDDGLDQSAVRYTPARPLKGASPEQIVREIKRLEAEMFKHARNLEFEQAARLRDEVHKLRNAAFGLPDEKVG